MREQRATVAVGLLVAVLSVMRVWSGGSDVLVRVLWAEDGLWALCAQKEGALTCAATPYAGYLQAPPQLVAAAVSWFPVEHWALAANLFAGAAWGLLGALTFASMSSMTVDPARRVAVALVPVLIPIAGIEVANTIANLNFPLLYCCIIGVVAFRPRSIRGAAVAAAVLAATLTSIASAVLLLPVLAVRLMRDRRLWGAARIILFAGVVAAAMQVGVSLLTRGSRPVALGRATVVALIDFVPDSAGSLLPGWSFGPMQLFEEPWLVTPLGRLSMALVLPAVALGLLASRDGSRRASGGILVLGIAVTAVPTLLFGPVNRYFVVLAATIAAALILASSSALSGKWLCVVGIALVGTWVGTWSASPFRIAEGSDWAVTLAAAQSECAAGADHLVSLKFAPNWPFDPAVLSDPKTNVVECGVLFGR